MYRAKLELLEFDLIAAENALHAAQSQLSRIQSLYETGDAPVTEFERQRAVLQNAELDLQRAKTVYGLFQSIADEADAAEPTDATDETDAPDTPEDAGTSDATDASDPAAASP
jgi:multidrug resistance efflux pump